MKNPTFATRWNADVIDETYEQWLANPQSVSETWQAFFEGFSLADQGGGTSESASVPASSAIKQGKVMGMIYAYRDLGHTEATLDPLGTERKKNIRLTLDRLGLSEGDFNDSYHTGNYLGGVTMKVGEIIDRLRKTYCGNIGVEYLHIQETEKRRWIQRKIEPSCNQPELSKEKKIRTLRKIIEAESFENFLQTRFIGQKRFSLEGGETAIAALDAIVEASPSLGIEEIVMGMAHRGRLNVLANIFDKSYEYIFQEFSENYIPDTSHGDGDVKYHLGYDNVKTTSSGQAVEIHLAANPSHLEAVDPVVLGRARARQRLRGDLDKRRKVLPILIHGDAAIAGQGIVAEVFNFSKLKGYRTGGTLHFVINNQIGFTTDPHDARSTMYCTAIGKMVEAPVFHVNGDDPLAVIHVTELALEYRQTFGEDVIIDMYCYRKHGHNESDEPAFTQPKLYKKIKTHPPVSKILGEKLFAEGVVSEKEVKAIEEDFHGILQQAFEIAKANDAQSNLSSKFKFRESTATIQPLYNFDVVKTGVPKSTLNKIAKQLVSFPKEINPNPKIKRQLDAKWKNFQEGKDIDWGFAESLAWGTLLLEGNHVRLSGQDCERGTFSHRHALIHDPETDETYVPLNDLEENQKGLFCVHNSLLSEAAVLGFDYGYSLDFRKMLCMWEAQFGDFANGAQVIFDQFISSSESKWGRSSGIVMLLPHGYEGQGPEHSSARLERYLQACAEHNIQVCNLTTPAQLFHVFRRQMNRSFVKPLVIMSPKSLLRHKECVSEVKEFVSGHFQDMIDDAEAPKTAERVILCSGKVYYDLIAYRRDNKIKNTAIIRVEQFYPFNEDLLVSFLKKYNKRKYLVWCQEEPANMGGWHFINHRLAKLNEDKLPIFAGRKNSASPATGSLNIHVREQAKLVEHAFLGTKTIII